MVRSMWLFQHKFHSDGTLSRYKTRLVANGSSQQLGIDFDETFSPVVKPATICTVLSLAVSRQWPIHQLDVKNAFLNGDLSETVYMHQPLGFVDNRYPYLGSQVTYLLIYVDDIILTASCPTLLQQIIGSLNNEFDMTDLGALNYFLGISADRTPTEDLNLLRNADSDITATSAILVERPGDIASGTRTTIRVVPREWEPKWVEYSQVVMWVVL
ncbi:ribonuclease H-like domain-containing protein [Tanacetum coccineum]